MAIDALGPDCAKVALSTHDPDLWAACCPTTTGYGEGATLTWEVAGVQFPCTEKAKGEALSISAAEDSWTNRQLFGVMCVTILFAAALAGVIYLIRRKFGACARIHWDHLTTLIQLRFYEWRTRGLVLVTDVDEVVIISDHELSTPDSTVSGTQDFRQGTSAWNGVIEDSRNSAPATDNVDVGLTNNCQQCADAFAAHARPATDAAVAATVYFADLTSKVSAHRERYAATHTRLQTATYVPDMPPTYMPEPMTSSEVDLAYCEANLCRCEATGWDCAVVDPPTD